MWIKPRCYETHPQLQVNLCLYSNFKKNRILFILELGR